MTREKTKVKIQDNREKREWDGERIVKNIPKISPSGEFAVLDISSIDKPAATSEYLQAYQYAGEIVTAAFRLYDDHGNILFQKEFSAGTVVVEGQRPELVVSDNGTVVVITGSQENPEGENILHVYRRSGLEILTYPQKEGSNTYPLSIAGLSKSGRYLAVRTGFFPEEPEKIVFFDLEKDAFWKADKDYGVYEVDDNGIAKTFYYDEVSKEPKEAVISLKKFLGSEL